MLAPVSVAGIIADCLAADIALRIYGAIEILVLTVIAR
jgi:hypothetical protein